MGAARRRPRSAMRARQPSTGTARDSSGPRSATSGWPDSPTAREAAPAVRLTPPRVQARRRTTRPATCPCDPCPEHSIRHPAPPSGSGSSVRAAVYAYASEAAPSPMKAAPEMVPTIPAKSMSWLPRTWNHAMSRAGTLLASQSAIACRPRMSAGAMQIWMIPAMMSATGDMRWSLGLRSRRAGCPVSVAHRTH
jgi:hypothetical protein